MRWVTLLAFAVVFSLPALAGTPEIGGTAKVAGSSWVGCKNREELEKLSEYAHQHDEVAFKKLLARDLANGECRYMKNGETVYITDVSILGYTKVRPRGEIDEYWVLTQALEPQ